MTAKQRWGYGKCFRGAVIALCLAPLLVACAPVYGGAVLVAVAAVGALTSRCYDYLDASVYDAQGRKTCGAIVTARNGGDEFELKSCYYAPLTDGHWTIRARLPGYPDTVATADVDHTNDCTRHTLSMELMMNQAGSRAPGSVLAPALPPPPPAPPSAGAAPAATNASPPAPAVPPAVDSAAPAPAPAAPASSAVPPVGVFPDQPAHPNTAK